MSIGKLILNADHVLCMHSYHCFIYPELTTVFVLCFRHIGIMHIKSDCTFKIDPIRLQTIRPFIIESTRLQGSGIHVSDEEGVYAFVTNKVKAMIEKVKEENPSTDKIPLVRLKVFTLCKKKSDPLNKI